jgi:hypothetical protein
MEPLFKSSPAPFSFKVADDNAFLLYVTFFVLFFVENYSWCAYKGMYISSVTSCL